MQNTTAPLCNIDPSLFLYFLCCPYIFTIFVETFNILNLFWKLYCSEYEYKEVFTSLTAVGWLSSLLWQVKCQLL